MTKKCDKCGEAYTPGNPVHVCFGPRSSNALSQLPPEFDLAGRDAMRKKAAATKPEHHAFGHMSDEWVADRVRMLMRGDLWHEAICTAGRDRIMRLSLEVSRLAGECANWKQLHDADEACIAELHRQLREAKEHRLTHEPCATHATEHHVRDTLPCPWCAIDELKRNRDSLQTTVEYFNAQLYRLAKVVQKDGETAEVVVTKTIEILADWPAQPPSALQAEVERMRKLFWLAKEDVIFFSGYDAKTDRWPDIDLFYTPCVTINDTFEYACADAQQLDDSEIDRLINAHKQWGYDGVVAWASLIRQCEPIVERRTAKYHEARSALTKEVGQ